MTFVHPSNDPFVMAGQGTLALELLAQLYVIASRMTSSAQHATNLACSHPLHALHLPKHSLLSFPAEQTCLLMM